MNITIIGAGNVGGTLGKLWAAKGHRVIFGVRNTRSEPIPNTEFQSIPEAIASRQSKSRRPYP